MTDNTLLEDVFQITAVDPDGKSFQRVSRFVGKSERFAVDTVCDYNSDLFKLQSKMKLDILLTLSIDDNGNIETNPQYNPRLKSRLLDEYEYVMFGKIFKIKQPTAETNNQTQIFISYGGLLMSLTGSPNSLTKFELDSPVYLLMRKSK